MPKKYACKCNEKEFYPAKVRATVNGFERIISFQSGYICSTPFTEGSSHGRHGMNMLFLLKGKEGAVQFVLYTGWMPDFDYYKEHGDCKPLPADLGYHSYKAHYDSQTSRNDCPWLDGKPCFYDGSGLNAIEVFKIFVSKGEEALWNELERYYKNTLTNN